MTKATGRKEAVDGEEYLKTSIVDVFREEEEETHRLALPVVERGKERDVEGTDHLQFPKLEGTLPITMSRKLSLQLHELADRMAIPIQTEIMRGIFYVMLRLERTTYINIHMYAIL